MPSVHVPLGRHRSFPGVPPSVGFVHELPCVAPECCSSHWTPWRRNRLTAITADNLMLGLDLVSNFQAFKYVFQLVVVGRKARHGEEPLTRTGTVRLPASLTLAGIFYCNSQVKSQCRFMSRAQMATRYIRLIACQTKGKFDIPGAFRWTLLWRIKIDLPFCKIHTQAYGWA